MKFKPGDQVRLTIAGIEAGLGNSKTRGIVTKVYLLNSDYISVKKTDAKRGGIWNARFWQLDTQPAQTSASGAEEKM